MTVAAMMTMVFMEEEGEEDVRSRVEYPDSAAVTSGVDARDANEVAGANADATRSIVWRECRQQLNDLTIDIECDQSLTVRVEVHHGARIVLDRTFEGRRGRRFKPEQHAPDRSDEQALECSRGENRSTRAPWLSQRCREQAPRTESDEQREEDARGEQRIKNVRALVGGVLRVTCMAVTSVCSMSTMASVPVCGMAMSCVGSVTTVARVASASEMRDATDRHRGQPCTAQGEAETIRVHTLNTTRRTVGW
jgi:hypothetical protein